MTIVLVILLIIPNSKLPMRMWWKVLKAWINYQIQGFSLQLKNGWLEALELVAFRGVARIFSEVRAILQIALPPPSGPLPPKKKKTTTTAFPNYIQIWLRCKPKSFFCIWNDISNLQNNLSRVWVHWLMQVNHLSYNKAAQISGVNPMPCKFAMFCSGNNFFNLSGYF